MSVKLRASSGTYHVQASELAGRTPSSLAVKGVPCRVHFLDDTEATFDIDKRAKAQVLLDKVYQHLELVERDYFGLQFADLAPAPDAMQTQTPLQPTHSDLMRWLDSQKPLKKQIRITPPYRFYFRVKFYVSDPSKLQEEYTRYHFFLQLKRDILEGRLVVPYKSAVLLASYAVQSELGDYNPDEHVEGYLSEFRFVPNQLEDFERDVTELHKLHRGQTPADSELNYLTCGKCLEMYGVDLHNARLRDQSNLEIQLGVTSAGLVVFQNNIRINTFSWAKIIKISFKRKQFFIQLRREVNDNVENLIGFGMVSYRSCKNLWKSCVEHHTFFRLHGPNNKVMCTGGGSGSSGSSHGAMSGKAEFQTQEENKRRLRVERSFTRSASKRYARRTVGGTTRAVILEEKNSIDGYSNLPHSSSMPLDVVSNHIADHRDGGTLGRSGSPPVKPVYPGRAGQSHLPTSTSYPSSFTRPFPQHDVNGSVNVRATLPNDYKPDSLGKKRGGYRNDEKMQDDNEGGFSSRPPAEPSDGPILPPKLGYVDEEESPEAQYELPAYNEYVLNGDGHGGLVTIRMKPDSQGRFGFNVKGGADQAMPIIVSRVAPNTPADLCNPRLNEGDQVLFINGRDVSQHTHEQVVQFIRASRETHSGELELVVRPNVYIGEDVLEEPDFQFIPDTPSSSLLPPGILPLQGSMMLLHQSLQSGQALAQFEQLYRKKPGLTMNAAKLNENIPKNRYRDISPYDLTRVTIQGASGDYINANYVNMEIPGSGVVNRYIAAQGPLPTSCQDFWEMIWEQQCGLVVMLTTKVERGRIKCHQYWPELYASMNYQHLQVTCTREEHTSMGAFREFTLTNLQGGEGAAPRHIEQMQYISWPDHGVPDDSTDFLDFVVRVRSSRAAMVEPTVVHCSAGIGRTGVLITMETAMCLIEANQPVYPLDTVRQMRDQRAMLIQTSSQYKFVCEAIQRVYNEKVVKPLDDYQR